MNKSAEQQAEEYALKSWGDPDNWMCDKLDVKNCKEDFLAGHHSRDEEVKKLVEVLEWSLNLLYNRGSIRIENLSEYNKAKEALKPYNQVTK